MKLCLSSAALPSGSLSTLAKACDRHALEDAACPLHEPPAAALPASSPPIRWLLLPHEIQAAHLLAWASVARELGAGLLLHAPVPDPPSAVPVALLHETDVEAAAEAAAWAHRHGAATAWDVAPGALSFAQVEALCAATGRALAHVRLRGSGPESEARGRSAAGQLMAHLALCNYGGTVALAPSPGADLYAWSRWLLHERGEDPRAERQARLPAYCHATPST